MTKFKISIITPVYNAEKYIERCIKSIKNQSYKNIEHIIIDDGSTDDTLKICQKYDKNIKLIHKENEGVSKARNVGLEKSTGDYVLFVDADDWLEKDMCEKLISKCTKKEVDIVVCGYNEYYENKKASVSKKLSTKKLSFTKLITDENTNFGGFPWNKLIKKSIIKNKFDEKVHYYENLLFFLQNCSENTNYEIVNECLYNYCINDTSAVHSKKYSLKKLSSLDALNKIIPLLPKDTVINHKIHYVNAYYNNLFSLETKMPQQKKIITNYKKDMNKYYQDIMQTKGVPIKVKLKLFCMHNLYFIYYIYKIIKDKKNEK